MSDVLKPGPKEHFGELLARCRKASGLTQRDLENKDLGLSYSFIAQLESGLRGKTRVPLSRVQIWYLVRRMGLWPWPSKQPNCDALLESAGMSIDRSAAEEQDIQKLASFDELWVFARVLLDPDEQWYQIVKDNITKKGVVYRYFTESPAVFHNLLARLKHDKIPAKHLNPHLECTLLPREFFVMSFAIYVRKQDNYCCGTKPVDGRAEVFYTLHSTETARLFELLREWRNNLNVNHPVTLSKARRVFPTAHQSVFVTA